MSSHDSHADHDPGHEVHVSSTSFYLVILGALIVLTVLTVLAAYQEFGWANDIVALGIAFSKATLVVLFFMHVKHSGRIIKLIVVSAVAWLFIMLSLTYIDYGSRHSIKPEATPVEAEYQDLIDSGFAKKANAKGGHGEEGGH